MSTISERIRREPALLVGLVSATLVLLTAFGVPLSEGQQAAIIGLIIAFGSIFVRQSVTPNVSVGALEDDQGSPNGELMAGQASSIPDGDPVDVIPLDETGAVDTSILLALACIVVILCGLVWLFQAL